MADTSFDYFDDPRKRRMLPPPPPNVPPATVPPPAPLPQQTAPPSSGLNSVGQALEKMRSQPLSTPTDMSPPAGYEGMSNQPTERPTDTPTSTVYPSEPPPPMHLSTLASKIAQKRELGAAPPNTPVTADSYGLPQVGATKPMSRRHAIAMGILQGALEGAARTGKWQGALGGAATGGVASGINPKLLYQLEQHQAEGRLQGDIDTEMTNRTNQAKLGDIAAQTKEREQQPELKRLQINEQLRREQDLEAGRNARSAAQIAAANKRAADRHKETVTRPQYRTDPTTGDIIEIVPGKEGGQATSRVLRKGSKEAQSALVSDSLYDTAGRMYDDKTSGYEALHSKADKLREQADKLAEDPLAAIQNAQQIKVLNKQADKAEQEAEDLKKKVQGLQAEGDKRRAESRVAPPADTGKGKSWSKSRWQAANPGKDAAAAEKAAQQRGYKVID